MTGEKNLLQTSQKYEFPTGPRLLGQAMSSCFGLEGNVQRLEGDCNRARRCGRDAGRLDYNKPSARLPFLSTLAER